MLKIKENKETKKNLVIVSKKIFKKATERNLLKRRIRSILYDVSKKTKKYFLVIVLSPEIKKIKFAELKEKVLEKINELCIL